MTTPSRRRDGVGAQGSQNPGQSGTDAGDGSPPANRREADPPEVVQFPRPPVTFADEEGRDIAVDGYDGDPEPLAGMYSAFDVRDRSQGIPPADDRRRAEWLDRLLSDGLNVVAWHGETPVGHATLMPMGDGGHELAIFVAPDYQHAGIGSKLLGTLFGYGRERGVERVWLTVERHNHPAVNLYESFGFRTLSGGRELEMERDLPEAGAAASGST